jgi:hypothetical protein
MLLSLTIIIFTVDIGCSFVAVQPATLSTRLATTQPPRWSLQKTTVSSRLWMTESLDDASPNDNLGVGNSEEVVEVETDAVIVDSDNGNSVEISTVPAWKRIVFAYKYNKKDDGLTFRQRLGKAGLSVVLSYGFVSNMSYCVSVSAAWYIFCKRTMLSPLAPGQWPKFLAVYSGFWVFNNIVRPIRFGLSMAISTQFDKIVQSIQNRFRVNKSVAIGLTVFFANIVGTITLMCLGISIAASLAGVPIRP